MSAPLFFSTFEVTRQAFHRTTLAFAIVNLKPIVPGHVLVCPTRPAARLADLRADELGELMCAVQRVGGVVERAYGADGLTVACQDGRAAGQTVPHVHFHILPRRLRDDRFAGARSDDVYPALERQEGVLPQDLASASFSSAKPDASAWTPEPLKMDADAARTPRSHEDMEREAVWLAKFFVDDA
ncbi:diadenosine 5',5'''-P1,P4-tetraphosphate asymmetrical hydrolase [Gloeopeniophorella convolvens]|nr:diadenosine 5',5'''-P1,P4-tetraphosphate asymmetrical hydrolase [Gloeopeniophorella convolvens]